VATVSGLLDRPPPHNIEAEEDVLGALLLSPDARTAVLPKLTAEDFYRPAHRTVFAAIVDLYARGKEVDVTLVHDRLRQVGAEEEIGGAPFLHTLVAGVATVGHATAYAATVAELAAQRRLLDAFVRGIQGIHEGMGAAGAAEYARGLLDTAAAGAAGIDQRRLLPGGAFILDQPPGVPAVWGSGDRVAWSQGEPLLLVGPDGVGKTTVAGQLTRARLGLDASVLGMPVTPGDRNVLYVACDRPQQAARSMRRLVNDSDREALDARLVVWKGPPPADCARKPDTLLRMAQAANADTVIADSVKDLALGLADDEVGAALNSAHQRLVVEGIEYVGLHHPVKRNATGGKPKGLEDVYGSRWITAGAGSVILLWGQAGDLVVELSHLKQPAEPVGPFKVLHDPDRGTSAAYQQLDVLDLLLHKPGLTAADLALQLATNGRPSDSDRERARRRLDKLVTAGLALCKPGSKGGRGGGTPAQYYASARLESDHGGDHAP
jgi:replicative DNA helicase